MIDVQDQLFGGQRFFSGVGWAAVLASAAMGTGKSVQQLFLVKFFRAGCTKSLFFGKVHQGDITQW